MTNISTKSLAVAASVLLATLSTDALAKNERLCSPNARGHEVSIKFSKGAFSFAGDGGGRAEFKTRYDNDNSEWVIYNVYEGNGFGGNTGVDYKLCHIDQAKGVGAPSTLIFVWGDKDNCGSWWGWTQVQSASVYSTCEVTKNNDGGRTNIVLK